MDNQPLLIPSSPDQLSAPGPISHPRGSRNILASISSNNRQNLSATAVISKIEAILERIANALLGNRVLTIPLRTRQSVNERLVHYPSTNASEVKRFSEWLTSN